MNLAYLVNQYPKVSHSFIRREILALESLGVSVTRFSVRSCASELVDSKDIEELQKTRILLQSSLTTFGIDLLKAVLTRPVKFLQALRLAFKVGYRSERGLLLHGIYLLEACHLLRWCREAEISHIHAHFGTNSTTVAMLCHCLGGPSYSFTVHGPEEFDKAPLLSLETKINRSKFVVAISNFGRSQLFRQCAADQWSKIHIIHCGVDQQFLAADMSPVFDTNQLICIGRLSEQKGHFLLIQAAALLAQSGINFKLLFVGDGELRPQVESLIAELGVQTYIDITGWASADEVKHHLMTSRAMVLPSFAEGLPVVIMEALSLGRPVLSTYIAGIPELVVPQESGWLVPAGSVEELAEAIKVILQTPVEHLHRMGTAGRTRVQMDHDAACEGQKLLALFQRYTSLAPLAAEPTDARASRMEEQPLPGA
jgi:glycosyltransferase involved in cell wall biosynthesis